MYESSKYAASASGLRPRRPGQSARSAHGCEANAKHPSSMA